MIHNEKIVGMFDFTNPIVARASIDYINLKLRDFVANYGELIGFWKQALGAPQGRMRAVDRRRLSEFGCTGKSIQWARPQP